MPFLRRSTVLLPVIPALSRDLAVIRSFGYHLSFYVCFPIFSLERKSRAKKFKAAQTAPRVLPANAQQHSASFRISYLLPTKYL